MRKAEQKNAEFLIELNRIVREGNYKKIRVYYFFLPPVFFFGAGSAFFFLGSAALGAALGAALAATAAFLAFLVCPDAFCFSSLA